MKIRTKKTLEKVKKKKKGKRKGPLNIHYRTYKCPMEHSNDAYGGIQMPSIKKKKKWGHLNAFIW